MKPFIPIILLLTLTTITYAQPALHWQHIYGDSLSETGIAGCVRLADGDLILAGEIDNSIPLLFDIHLTRITADGDSVWMRALNENGTQHARACTLTPDGNIAVAGSYSYEFNDDYFTNCLLHIFDPDGNVIWSWYEGTSSISEAFAVMVTPDDGFILAGYYKDHGDPDTRRDVWCVKIDQNGSREWSFAYDIDGRDEATTIDHHPDGGYMIGGHAQLEEGPFTWNAFLLHIDGNGTEIDRCHFIDESDSQYIYDLHFTTQGQLYMAGEATVPWMPDRHTDGYLKLLDPDLIPIFSNYYGGNGYDGFRKIQPLPEGDLMLVGHAQSYSGNGNNDMFAVRVSANGARQWMGSFGDLGKDKGYAVVPVEGENETQYIITGTSSPENQSWTHNVIAARISDHPPLFDLELMTAEDDTIEIPAEGGSFAFDAILTNNRLHDHSLQAWVAVVDTFGQLHQPLNHTTVSLPAQTTQTYSITQPFPANYPAGIYLYIGRLGFFPDNLAAADTLILRKAEPDPPFEHSPSGKVWHPDYVSTWPKWRVARTQD